MSQPRIPFPHDASAVAADSASANPHRLFSVSFADGKEQNLISELLLKINSKTDDELMKCINEAVDNKQFSLDEAADLFYSLVSVCPSNRELRGAALTLQLSAAQAYAAESEWYCDRHSDLEKIAKKLSLSNQEKVYKLILARLMAVTQREIELLTTVADPQFLGKMSASCYATHSSGDDLVALVLKNGTQPNKALQLSLTELGQLPVLLEFFERNKSPAFKERAKEKYKLVDKYRQRHDKLLSLSLYGTAIGVQPQFRTESLEKALVLLGGRENIKTLTSGR